jgi:DNA-nicking Smr family endonuclease
VPDSIPELDLHGLRIGEALTMTRRFLEQSQEQGFLTVSVVYGKGKGSPGGEGVLRVLIPRAMENEWNDLVAAFRRRVEPDGRDGGVEVDLRPAEEP